MDKAPLRNTQKRGIKYCLSNPYCIVALDPGLGKSRIAIETRERRGKTRHPNCLIVAPSHLIPNWKNQIATWAPPGRIVTAITSGKDIYDLFDTDYAIISYELSQKAEQFFEWADMVVLDEAHYLKTMEAKRTEFIHKSIYENSLKSVLMLTGTPIKNRVSEYYSLLALTHYNPAVADSKFLEKFPTSIDFADHFSYRHEYTMEVGFKRIKVVKWVGVRNLPELKKWLKGNYLRINGDQDLPPLIFKDVIVSEKSEDELEKAFLAFFSDEGKDSVKPRAKADAALAKAPLTIKYCKDLIEEVGPIVVFSDHVEASEKIAQGLGTVALNGNVPVHTRAKLAKRWQEGAGGPALVASIPALKEGVDLVRANHLILNDLPWVPGDLTQVIHRIRRISQKKTCVVHRILGSPQDKKIGDVIIQKTNDIKLVT